MKFAKCFVAGIAVMSMVLSAQAGGSVGIKLWNASFSDSDVAEDTLMVGPTLSFGGDTAWVSAMYMQGDAETDYADVTLADAEVVVGFTFNVLDLGLGARYTTWTTATDDDEWKIWGPMAYLALGSTFGDSPIGWYAGASWMFLDLGDAKDAEDDFDVDDITYEHINAEAGISLNITHFQATLGYRMKYYLNYNDTDETEGTVDIGHSGLAASASFVF